MRSGDPTETADTKVERREVSTLSISHDDTIPAAALGDAAAALPVRDPARYRRTTEIARGGMGRIVAARDEELGRDVAIKELLAASPMLARRFVREVRLTMQLQHPAIIAVLDAGRWPDGAAFYAMPHVAGRALRDVVADAGSLDRRIALVPHVLAVADALGYAHGRGVIHRDLKPANILVGAFGETLVIDWGLAKLLREPDDDAPGPIAPAGTGTTVLGQAIGTPAYMPPEQARGEPVDARADVYAIGALLYHVLAQQPPHGDVTDAAAVVDRNLAGPPRALDELVADAPPDLLAIVAKAMARDPAGRYPTAAELAVDLRRFTTGNLVAAHRYSLRQLLGRWLARHRAAVGVAAAAAVVLAVVGVVAVQGIRAQRDDADAQRAVAEQHRGQVEGLLDFLLGDLHRKLEPIGKLDLLGLVVDRADAYYRDRPLDGAPDAVRRRALIRLHGGDVRFALGDLPGGLVAYRDALGLFQRTADAASIASADEKIGAVLFRQGDLSGATAAVRDAIALRRRRATGAPADGEAQRALAAVLRTLGLLQTERSQLDDALASLRESLAISQQLASRDASTDGQFNLAVAHAKLGDVFEARAELPAALAEYRSAQPIFEALAARAADDTRIAYALSGNTDNIAGVLQAQKDYPGALGMYRASRAITARLAEREPANAEWQRGISLADQNIGTALRDQGDHAGALAQFLAAHAIRVRLAARDATNMEWQHELSVSFERVGGAQLELGRLDDAAAAYRDSLAIRERLAVQDPTNTTWQRDLFIAHYKLGTVAESRGDADAARRSYQITFDGLARLSAAHPDDASLRGDVDEIRAWLARCCERPAH